MELFKITYYGGMHVERLEVQSIERGYVWTTSVLNARKLIKVKTSEIGKLSASTTIVEGRNQVDDAVKWMMRKNIELAKIKLDKLRHEQGKDASSTNVVLNAIERMEQEYQHLKDNGFNIQE